MVDAETITIDSFQRKFGLSTGADDPAEEISRRSPEGRPPVQQHYSFVKRRPDGQSKRGPTMLEIRADGNPTDINCGQSDGQARPPAISKPVKSSTRTLANQLTKESTRATAEKHHKTVNDVENKEGEDYSRKPLPPEPSSSPPSLKSPTEPGERGGREQNPPVIESAVIATSEDEEHLLPPGIRRVPRPPVRRRPKSTPAAATSRSKSTPGLTKDASR
jgi:hypothetical protein